MHHVRPTRLLWTRGIPARGRGQVSRRGLSIEPQTPPPHPLNSSPSLKTTTTLPKQPSRVGAYYKSFSYPVLKSFLIALFTYQIAYYAWMKLETIEEKHDITTEIRVLQEELKEAILQQKQRAGDAVDEVVDKVGEYTEDAKEAGRAVVEKVREGGEDLTKGTRAVGKVAGGGWWPW